MPLKLLHCVLGSAALLVSAASMQFYVSELHAGVLWMLCSIIACRVVAQDFFNFSLSSRCLLSALHFGVPGCLPD